MKFLTSKRIISNPFLLILPVAVFLLIIGLGLYFNTLYTQNLHRQNDLAVKAKLDTSAIALSQLITKRLLVLTAIKSFVLSSQQIEPHEAFTFTSEIIHDIPFVKKVSIAPGGIETFIFPQQKNHQPLDLLNESSSPYYQHIQTSLHAPHPIIITSLSTESNEELIAFQSIHKKGNFWGLAMIVLDFTKLLESAHIIDQKAQINFGIKKDSTILFGQQAIFTDHFTTSINLTPHEVWTIAVEDTRHHEEIERSESVIAFLIILLGTVICAILLGYAHSQNYLEEKIQQAKAHLIEYLNILSKKNEELHELSITDMLTGCYNRVKLDEAFQAEIERFNRYRTPFSIIMIDIDNFKKINDNFGHHVGDQILKETTSLFKHNLRSTDILGRWGGEEFLVIAPETDLSQAYIYAEKLRKIIETHQFPHITSLSISLGVSEITPYQTKDMIIQNADKALYKAKHQGRNQTCTL